MSRIPEQASLPMNMKLPLCQGCLQRGGDYSYMGMILGRDFEQHFGYYWYECAKCGRLDGPFQCPLYWLSVTNLDELNQILAFEKAGATVEVPRVSDLSPGAKEVLDQFGTNPLTLAEAMASLALKRGADQQRIEQLEEQLADSPQSSG